VRTAQEILAQARTIAVVGASRHAYKEAHAVPLQIQRHGWRVIPVNPAVDEVWGERAYPSLADLPEQVDFVNVFRPSADATDVVRQVIDTKVAPAVWLQLGIFSPEGRLLAEAAGIDYVEDTCLAVVRARYDLSAPPTP
jgi:predicted CoA-binding protein